MAIYNIGGAATETSAPAAPANGAVGTTSASIGTAAGKGFSIFNTGNTTIYIAVAATPTTTLFAAKIPPGYYYEDAFRSVGAINAIGSAAGGTCNVTVYN